MAAKENTVKECLEEQLLEIELLQSIYSDSGEFCLDETSQLEDITRFLKGQTSADFTPPRIGFTLTLTASHHSTMSILCRLPLTYPRELPPEMSLISHCLNREAAQNLSLSLNSYIEDNFCQEAFLYQVFMWLAEYCRDFFRNQSQAQASATAGGVLVKSDNERPYCRMWLYSHHIYNKMKRRDIINWSNELRLTGFCIPGKPGMICVEGPEFAVEDYWQRLRRLTWKKLVMKEREVCPDQCSIRKFKRFSDFQELNFSGKVGKGREIHMDWGEVIKFLEDNDFKAIIPLYFGDIVD